MCLDKPFIHSLLAEGTPDPVNFNECFTFKKFDLTQNGPSASARFHILFSKAEQGVGPKEIVWKYRSITDRDTEYSKILALISTPIQ